MWTISYQKQKTVTSAILFSLLLVAIVMMTSCEVKNNNETVDFYKKDSITPSLTKKSIYLKKLMGENKSIFRGLSFHMTISEVAKSEDSLEIVESNEHLLSYNLKFNPVEESDITYYFDKNNGLEKIEVVIYPGSLSKQDSIYNELYQYYNQQYLLESNNGINSTVWKSQIDDYSITLAKTGTNKIHDIQLTFLSLE